MDTNAHDGSDSSRFLGRSPATTKLKISLLVTGVVFAVELVGGIAVDSLSVISNAGHMLVDIGALALSFWASGTEHTLPNSQHSYGYGRSGIVAALVNALVLGAVGLSITVTGAIRLFYPTPARTGPMIALAALALALNLATALYLHRHAAHDLNVKSVFWHVAGDAMGSLGIIVAALAIRLTGWPGWDPIAAIFIGLIIAGSAYRVGRSSIHILMEAAPAELDPVAIVAAIGRLPAVDEVHHLHIWSLVPGYHALSAHVRTSNISLREAQTVLRTIEVLLQNQFNISHVTLQLETDMHDDETDSPCLPGNLSK